MTGQRGNDARPDGGSEAGLGRNLGIDKDTVQAITESAATHVGNIATIITGAVRDVTRETGDWFSDLLEMREASERAAADTDEAPTPTARGYTGE